MSVNDIINNKIERINGSTTITVDTNICKEDKINL